MKTVILTIFIIIFFQACSFKAPTNQWQYSSSNAFTSYMKNFLFDKEELANDDLQRAITYAKQGADFEQLARIYLGQCALNISVGIDDKCLKYKQIDAIVSSKNLEAYYLMLQKNITKKHIKNLPAQYEYFSEFKIQRNYEAAFNSIENMEQLSSQLIAASLIKEHLNKSQINYLIKKSSFYGFKKAVIFWLENLEGIEKNQDEKMKINKKIMILKSK